MGVDTARRRPLAAGDRTRGSRTGADGWDLPRRATASAFDGAEAGRAIRQTTMASIPTLQKEAPRQRLCPENIKASAETFSLERVKFRMVETWQAIALSRSKEAFSPVRDGKFPHEARGAGKPPAAALRCPSVYFLPSTVR